MTFSLAVALAALAFTIGTTLLKSGVWAGTTAATAGDVKRLEDEVKVLRQWRHKVGDDPADSVFKLYGLLEQRVERLEQRGRG